MREWFPAGGRYAITDGRHHIAKYLKDGVPGYLVWLDGVLVPGQCFASSAEAKAYISQVESNNGRQST